MTESFGERLRRLRKEPAAPQAETEASTERAALPEWFRERLTKVSAEPTEAAPATVSAGDPRELVDFASPRGAACARVTQWGLAHRHGAMELGSALRARPEDLALVGVDTRLAHLRLERALFLDIETTGLAGGAGTKAFLVGLGRFTGDGFELWQGFLRGPEDEAALLDECARRVASAGALVSFFGKSFDRHRLEDKMRLHGIDAPFERCLHLDLYHPCRRLYGAGLANGRLATMEREIAGVERPHDLPGAFAPAAWYDYLAGRAHRLEEVFEHNRDDILSLVAIASALARLASDDAPSALPSTRSLALARCAERVGRWRECRRWCELAMLDAEQAVEAVALAARACEELAEEEAFDGLLARARQLGASELEARVERRRSRVLRRS